MVRTTAVSSAHYAAYLERDIAERVLWEGKLAERLGIDGQEVTKEAFTLLARGVDPTTGEVLRTRATHNLTNGRGDVIGYARSVYDTVVHAPKSVSIMALVDERLKAAHHTATEYVKREIEEHAGTRIRIGGRSDNRPTGEVIQGAFPHSVSRALDPQMHTHIATINLTYDPVEGAWKALQAHDLYTQRPYITNGYRSVLGEQVERLGYELERPADHFQAWRIKGVTPEIEDKFGQRSQQIQEQYTLIRDQHGYLPKFWQNDRVAVWFRPDKQILAPEEYRTINLQRLGPDEYGLLQRIHEQAQIQAPAMRNTRIILNDGSDSEIANVIQRWNYGQRNTKQKVS